MINNWLKFEEVEMIKDGHIWVSPWVDVPGTDEVAWYVEAENTFVINIYELPRRDVSLVRFLWRLPEVGCEIDAPDWCEPFPDPPTITGPSNGKVGAGYKYIIVTTDPDGDDIYYFIDWGDDTFDEWIGPYKSGEEIIVSHAWNKKGDYNIKVKAKNINSVESDWSDPLPVSMPKNKAFNPLFLRFLENHPCILSVLGDLLGL